MTPSTARGIPGLAPQWQQFGVCCVFHFLVPLSPFLVEHYKAGHVSIETLTIGGAVYVLALGASSRAPLTFALSVALGLALIVAFGLATATPAPGTVTPTAVWWSIAGFMVFNVIERFNRHVIERTPYWEFMQRTRETV